MTKKSKKRTRVEITFNENDRRDFLTGFRKRKQERRDTAAKKFEKQVKNERKKLRKEMREAALGMTDQLQPNNFLFTDASQQQPPEARQMELPDHTVSVMPVDIWQHSPANLLASVSAAPTRTTVEKTRTKSVGDNSDTVPGMDLSAIQTESASSQLRHDDVSDTPANRKILRTNERLQQLKNAKKTKRIGRLKKRVQKKLTKKSHRLKKIGRQKS